MQRRVDGVRSSTPSSRCSHGNDVASMAWGVRDLFPHRSHARGTERSGGLHSWCRLERGSGRGQAKSDRCSHRWAHCCGHCCVCNSSRTCCIASHEVDGAECALGDSSALQAASCAQAYRKRRYPDKEDYELADASSRSALDKQERQSAIKHSVRPATVLHPRTRLGHSRTARV